MLESLKPLQFWTHYEYLETTAVLDSPHGEVLKFLRPLQFGTCTNTTYAMKFNRIKVKVFLEITVKQSIWELNFLQATLRVKGVNNFSYVIFGLVVFQSNILKNLSRRQRYEKRS
jgi:hypothetical protein